MRTLYIIIYLLICLSAKAQVSVGIKGGINIADLEVNYKLSEGYTSNQRISAHGGLLINFQITRLVSLQTELNISPQGGVRDGMQAVAPIHLAKLV